MFLKSYIKKVKNITQQYAVYSPTASSPSHTSDLLHARADVTFFFKICTKRIYNDDASSGFLTTTDRKRSI